MFHFPQLVTHSHIHTGARPYKCNYCGRAFRHLSTKSKHNCPNKPAVIGHQVQAVAAAGDEDEDEQEVQEQHQHGATATVIHTTRQPGAVGGQWSTLAHEEIVYQHQVAQAVHSIQTIQEIAPQPKPTKKKRRRRY